MSKYFLEDLKKKIRSFNFTSDTNDYFKENIFQISYFSRNRWIRNTIFPVYIDRQIPKNHKKWMEIGILL